MESIIDALTAAEYTTDAVMERIGEAGQRALNRNSTIASDRAVGETDDPLATLIRLFILQQPLDVARVAEALPVEDAVTAGLVARDGDQIRALIDVRPYSSDDGTRAWIVSDLTCGLDTPPPPMTEDYVLGLSPASTQLTQLMVPGRFDAALDLGSGCGIQSVHLAQRAERVVATDLNPRANALAGLTFELNGLEVEQRLGSLYEPVAGERFDLIVTNPPYVMSPPSESRLTYREGVFTADGLVHHIVANCADHLNPGGVLQVLGNWAILDPDRWAERLTEWIPAGCDALIIERERLDPYEYIEIWLTDAGLAGSEDFVPRYRQWLEYFDRLGITEVGMGWINVRNSGAAIPEVRVESWPHAVQQPVGPAIAEWFDAVTLLRGRGDDGVLDAHWTLAEGILQETLGEPGAADPNHIVFRQYRGLRRAIETDTALAAVLGACDGELTPRQIIGAVAALLDADADALTKELVPKLREAVIDGFLAKHASE